MILLCSYTQNVLYFMMNKILSLFSFLSDSICSKNFSVTFKTTAYRIRYLQVRSLFSKAFYYLYSYILLDCKALVENDFIIMHRFKETAYGRLSCIPKFCFCSLAGFFVSYLHLSQDAVPNDVMQDLRTNRSTTMSLQ